MFKQYMNLYLTLQSSLIIAVTLLAASAVSSQETGATDSLKAVVISNPLLIGQPSQSFVVACSAWIDNDTLTTLQFALDWDNPEIVLDSAKAFEGLSQMDFSFLYLDDNVQVSNDSNIVIVSGTCIFSCLEPSLNWQHLANFYFTVPSWSISSSIQIDTVMRPVSSSIFLTTEYIAIRLENGLGGPYYQPHWFGSLVVGGSTGIDESDLGNIPATFELAQNYPNPFNPATRIKFGLPSNSLVTLKVYNLLGQEIATLVDETVKAGTHETEWNGKDKNGADVSSGIYFYKLTAGDFVETKKMMLVK